MDCRLLETKEKTGKTSGYRLGCFSEGAKQGDGVIDDRKEKGGDGGDRVK